MKEEGKEDYGLTFC